MIFQVVPLPERLADSCLAVSTHNGIRRLWVLGGSNIPQRWVIFWWVRGWLVKLFSGLGVRSSVFWAICSFYVSEREICSWKRAKRIKKLSKHMKNTNFSSYLLVYCEQFAPITSQSLTMPFFKERIAHGRSLKWAILCERGNEQKSEEWMSKRAKSEWAKERRVNEQTSEEWMSKRAKSIGEKEKISNPGCAVCIRKGGCGSNILQR